MSNMRWLSASEFQIGNVVFFSDTFDSRPDQSTKNRFHIMKDQSFFDVYNKIFSDNNIKNMIEIGIFDGGSTMYFLMEHDLKKLFALDIRGRIVNLDESINENMLNDKVNIEYATSQDSPEGLKNAVNYFSGQEIDLIIDDASHLFDLSKKTFEMYFPILKSGGTYVLEDWGWSHNPGTQPGGSVYEYMKDYVSLSNLLFILQMIMISRPDLIAEIHVTAGCAVIKKGSAAASSEILNLDAMVLNRGQAFVGAA
jgi:Methyltransferase domain